MITIFLIVLIIGLSVICYNERKSKLLYQEGFNEACKTIQNVYIEQQAKRSKIIPITNTAIKPVSANITVARWMCVQCHMTYTLNYYKLMYNLSKDSLDIEGSHRTYQCNKCGNNLMQLYFTDIPYKDRMNPWKQ